MWPLVTTSMSVAWHVARGLPTAQETARRLSASTTPPKRPVRRDADSDAKAPKLRITLAPWHPTDVDLTLLTQLRMMKKLCKLPMLKTTSVRARRRLDMFSRRAVQLGTIQRFVFISFLSVQLLSQCFQASAQNRKVS